MVDEIQGSVDIVVQLFDMHDDDGFEEHDHQNDKNPRKQCISHDGKKRKEKDKRISIVHVPEYRLHARPLYLVQQKDIRLIREAFKQQNRLLLKTYKSHAMYSCTSDEFETNISKFFTETNAYSLIEELNETNRASVETHLDGLVNNVKTALDHLLEEQCINSMQHQDMQIHRSKVRLDYLFFLPDTRKNDVSVQPIVVSSASPLINISRWLHRLLQPTYDQLASSISFAKGADMILSLEKYKKQGFLRSMTLFATLHVQHISSMFDHEEAVQALEHFLTNHVSSGNLRGVSISTIVQLVRLLVDQQWFVYNNKIYRQIRGSVCGSPLMSLLVNIILFQWEKEFVSSLKEQQEIYGRYIRSLPSRSTYLWIAIFFFVARFLDEIFFTWNRSANELETFIHSINMKNSSIQVQYTIGTELDYLDASIRYFSDEDDQSANELTTYVNHESKSEPYTLPYLYGYPSDLMHSKLIRAALIRAVLCCSDVYEFQQERQYIELSFSLNRFPASFIHEYVVAFFYEFYMEELDHMMFDRHIFDELRENVIEYERKRVEKKLKQKQEEHKSNLEYVTGNIPMLHDVQYY
ncbi:unnamed protein product [Rotaria sp. Silwood2]|nr:unnamed protein product [Rotaria sp. Silwood2]CAF2975911.1 unnamed protein product [Rotaria sp. Silwood2]CAF3476388.1 unnamed protein product [Rotaria sp. Silwood2]CAF4003193.1 unnamed protein product [Rotaria sp. Silwood2]CAF4066145.1 unnamed protein product [Rotaria sp. Silwood2]